MVDVPRLTTLLERISSEVERLRKLSSRSDAELIADPDLLPSIKYGFIVAIEAAVDAARHCVASEAFRPPQTYADAFTVLEEQGWLEPDLAARCRRMTGFRNLLVHEYLVVDDEKVLAILRSSLDDLAEFRRAIASRIS